MPQTMVVPSGCHSRAPRSVFQCDLSHLTPEAHLLVLLARTSVNGTIQVEIQDRLRDQVNWTLLWQLARAHGVASLVYRTLVSLGGGAVPRDTMEAFRRHVQANAILSSLLTDELVDLVDAFAAKGIPVIPVKGPTLAATAYGDLMLRDCVDLDFIVGQSFISQARQLLWSRGYQLVNRASAQGDGQDEAFHSFVKKNGIFRVDLQWVMTRRLFSFHLDREQFWNQLKPVRFGQRTVMALAPEELLIVLCIQGSKHLWEDLQLVCDVAELLRRRRAIDWSRVLFLSREWGCHRMLLMGLALAHTLFDTPLPRALRDRVAADQDIPDLAKRMPKGLLRAGQEGIEETDAEALFLTLKDWWIDRWKYGLALCHAEVPVVMKLRPWFRFQGRLNMLYQLFHPFHRAAARCARFLRIKKVLVKWLATPG